MYVYQEFPKWKYHAEKEAKIIHSKEEEEKLGPEWVAHPDLAKKTASPVTELKPAQKRIKKA